MNYMYDQQYQKPNAYQNAQYQQDPYAQNQSNLYQVPPNQYGSPSYEPPKGKSGLGIAGLILGIIAILTSFIPIVNNISFFIALVGLILSIIGMVGVSKGKTSGKGLTIAALVLNILSLIIVLATQALFTAVLDEATNTTSDSIVASSSSSSESGESSSAVTPATSSSASSQSSTAKYAVTIDGCKQTQDYAGKPAIVVSYTWTNNSDSATNFIVAISNQAYQNGVELDTAIVMDADTASLMSDVKPGASTTVQQAFLLDDTSDVTIECTELISLNRQILAERTFSVS